LALRHVRPAEQCVACEIASVGGCVLYDRRALAAVGGFGFWPQLPEPHCGEDVLVQQPVLARASSAP
jgi:hypothetical protein